MWWGSFVFSIFVSFGYCIRGIYLEKICRLRIEEIVWYFKWCYFVEGEWEKERELSGGWMGEVGLGVRVVVVMVVCLCFEIYFFGMFVRDNNDEFMCCEE